MAIFLMPLVLQDHRVNIAADRTEELLQDMASEPVVYLARFVRVTNYGVKRYRKLERRFMPKCSFNKKYIGSLWQDAFNTEKESYSYPQDDKLVQDA